MVYNILDYGAKADGVTLSTKAIQAAIDDCHKNGGGRVLVPTGSFYSGSIFMRDNVELHLECGALLTASANMDDYNAEDAYPQNYGFPPEEWVGKHFIMAVECNHVAITGLGTINGNGDSFREAPTPPTEKDYVWFSGRSYVKDKKLLRPGQLICFIESTEVYVQGITIRNAPCWCLFVHGCEQVRIHGIQIFNAPAAMNTDGIDIDCSRFVTISDCNINTGDDAITFRCAENRLKTPRPCEFVTVTNCNLASSTSVFRIGVGSGRIRHIRVSNITIERGSKAVHLITSYLGKGAAKIEDVNFSGISVKNVSSPIMLEGDRSFMKNITIENFRAECIASTAIKPAEECDISNILFKDIEIYVKRENRELTEIRRAARGEHMLYVGTARDVTLDNVRVFAEDSVVPLWTSRFHSEKTDGLTIRNCNFD